MVTIMTEQLYIVKLPYACYNLIIEDNKVKQAPPIADWMKGKSLKYIGNWIKNKNGTFEIIKGEEK